MLSGHSPFLGIWAFLLLRSASRLALPVFLAICFGHHQACKEPMSIKKINRRRKVNWIGLVRKEIEREYEVKRSWCKSDYSGTLLIPGFKGFVNQIKDIAFGKFYIFHILSFFFEYFYPIFINMDVHVFDVPPVPFEDTV